MNAKANNTIDKVRELQRKLYLSAKINKKRKFHALYDKIYREDTLSKAWQQVKANKGSGGVDDIYIKDVVAYGESKFIDEIRRELLENRYQPKPVKRVYIPKKDGNKRPLGIPVIKDRVIQMATKIIIEPIFEADFKEYSYGFRPKRSQHDALEVIKDKCIHGGWWVLDADIKSYFDSINHDKLMILIERRISDKRVIKLIRKWLKVGIIEDKTFKQNKIGAPQGGVISPLLSNIYLNYFDTVWDKYYKHLGTLVKFADDFVVISRTKKDINHVYKAVQQIFDRLELQLHTEKTKLINIWEGKEGFDFLGFHNKYVKMQTRQGKEYHALIQIPSKKAMKSMRQKIKELIGNKNTLKCDMYDMVQEINKKLIGFKNYYGLKYARNQLNKIDWYVIQRFTIWYNRKKQIRPRHTNPKEVAIKIKEMGIVKLSY